MSGKKQVVRAASVDYAAVLESELVRFNDLAAARLVKFHVDRLLMHIGKVAFDATLTAERKVELIRCTIAACTDEYSGCEDAELHHVDEAA